MKRFGYIATIALFALAATLPLCAQEGCVDSPENPTVVLGLIVGAASIGFVQVRNRIASRRNLKNK
jgi:XrtJ-associated TM-motif-TM protein